VRELGSERVSQPIGLLKLASDLGALALQGADYMGISHAPILVLQA